MAFGLFAGCGGGDGGKQMAPGGSGHWTGNGGRGDAGGPGPGGAGLEGGPAGSGGAPAHQAGGESWTFLVYMAADNNLEPFAVQDLTEMAAVGSTDKVKIVVEIDRSAGYSNQAIADLPNFTGAKRLLVHKNSLEVIETLGAVDSGKGSTLQQFVTWGTAQYPADRTALVLWDHGGGWAGFAVDESVNSIIRPPAIKSAIAQGLSGTPDARLALIIFDACLMGTFEIANMMKPFAEYMLASEEVVPGHGLDYRALAGLVADPTMAPPVLARQLIDGFVAQAIANRDQTTITSSIVDLYALGPVEASLRALAMAGGMPLPATKATQAGRARARARSYGDQGQTPGVMVDVVDFASILAASDTGYATASAAIAAAVRGAVLYETHGALRAGSNGLSVYFPMQMHEADPSYEQIMDVAAWRSFLYAYLGIANNGAVAAPTFTNPDNEATGQIVNGSFVVTGSLAPGSAAVINKATLYYGLYDATSDTLYILGSTPAAFDTTTVQGIWDLGILRLDQGAAAEYGYLSVEGSPDGGISLTIPFVYRQTAAALTGQDAFRILAFDAGNNLLQDSYFVQSGDVLGALTVAPGSTLKSTILVSDAAGQAWQETPTAFDASTAIVPSLEQVTTGQIVFGLLLIENIQEESSYVVAVATAP